jgi:hypothetical protein
MFLELAEARAEADLASPRGYKLDCRRHLASAFRKHHQGLERLALEK